MAQAFQTQEWYANVPRSARTPTLCGLAVIALTVGGFGAWSSTALIAGAIVASGSFVATGANKIVQHFEGGVIEELVVREGDVVGQGDVLVRLDETAAKAELRRLVLREARALAVETRLKAELDGETAVVFPPQLLDQSSDPDITEILERERQALAVRQSYYDTELSTLSAGIDALQQRIDGGQQQLSFVDKQLTLMGEELSDKKVLLDRGLIRRPEVLALQRAHASLQGETGRLNGEIGDARERIARIDEQKAMVRNDRVKTVIEQMHEVSAELKDVRERIRAARDVLNRIVIRAPVSGIVVKMNYHTAGGVIEGGKSILEIVPLNEELIIEARIQPKDIDAVKQRQPASVRLVALNRRITPTIPGEVIYVSADSVGDETQVSGKRDVYLARIRLDTLNTVELADFRPTPGMPAEVYIKTADRTFLEYLVKPILDSMSRAFRES